MNSNIQKILFAVIFIILIFVLAVVYKQQLAINKLQNSTLASTAGAQVKPPSLAETLKRNAINQKTISGTMKEIAADFLTVDAEIVDVSKIQEGVDYVKTPLLMIQKTFKVSIAPETKFPQKQKSDIMVGDKLVIYTDKPPYGNDALKAMVISPASQSGLR